MIEALKKLIADGGTPDVRLHVVGEKTEKRIKLLGVDSVGILTVAAGPMAGTPQWQIVYPWHAVEKIFLPNE